VLGVVGEKVKQAMPIWKWVGSGLGSRLWGGGKDYVTVKWGSSVGLGVGGGMGRGGEGKGG